MNNNYSPAAGLAERLLEVENRPVYARKIANWLLKCRKKSVWLEVRRHLRTYKYDTDFRIESGMLVIRRFDGQTGSVTISKYSVNGVLRYESYDCGECQYGYYKKYDANGVLVDSQNWDYE